MGHELYGHPVPTLNWVFKYQPIASDIFTQPSHYKRTKKQSSSRRKRFPPLWPGSCLDYTSKLTHLLKKFMICRLQPNYINIDYLFNTSFLM